MTMQEILKRNAERVERIRTADREETIKETRNYIDLIKSKGWGGMSNEDLVILGEILTRCQNLGITDEDLCR